MILEKLEIQFTANVSGALKNINALKKAVTGTKSADKVKVDADTAKAEKKLKAVAKQVKDIPDGDVDVTADTSEAEGKLKAVAKQAQSLPDADIDVTADTTAAERQLKSVAKQVNDLPDAKITVKVDSAEAEKQLRDGGSGLFMAGGIKGAAIVGGAVTLGKGGYDLAETAYGAQSAQNRLEILLPEEAVTRVERYSRSMYDLYGLNETATKSRVTNFASVFRGIGVETGTAVEYAERMSDAAIDYASALDKTPQEVTDIMMSLMRGNTAVADNIGLFGLTVDKLNKKAEELEAEGLMPENIDEESRKYIALLHILEENADVQGFTGDWARTSDEFGNQVSILGEQWETLKEKAGALLLPAANWIVGGLNDIINALNTFSVDDNKFSAEIESYFGTMNLSDEEITKMVDDMVAPVRKITKKLNDSKADLSAAYDEYGKAYSDFWKKLNILYMTGEPITDETEEEIAELWDAVETAGIDGENGVLNEQRYTLTDMFIAFAGDESQWTAATERGIKAIDTYFDALIAQSMTKSGELSKAMREAFSDDVLTAEEKKQIQAMMEEVNASVYEHASIAYGARSQIKLDELNNSADWSAQSWFDLMKKAAEAGDEETAEMEAYYNELEMQMYSIAEKMHQDYEKYGEDKFAEMYPGFTKPVSGYELMEGARRGKEKAKQDMLNNVTNQTATMGAEHMRKYVEDYLSKAAEGGLADNNGEFGENILKPFHQQKQFMEHLQEAQASGVPLNEDALWLLQMYNFVNDKYGEWDQYNTWYESNPMNYTAAAYLDDNSLYNDFVKLFGDQYGYPIDNAIHHTCGHSVNNYWACNCKHLCADAQDEALCLCQLRTQCFLSNWHPFCQIM